RQADAKDKTAGKKYLKDLELDGDEDKGLRALQLRKALMELGFTDKQRAEELTRLCLADPKKLDASTAEVRWELLWRVHIHQVIENRAGARAAAHMAQVFQDQVKASNEFFALNRDLTDLGVLGLVFRSRHRLDGWVIALL